MNEQTRFWFTAALRIKDASFLHEDIVKKLGPGSECHKRGDPVKTKPGKYWSRDLWMVLAPLDESTDINQHLDWISSLIQPHADSLLEWKSKGAKIDVFMTYACSEEDRGFALVPESLSLFTKLGLTLEVSVA